MLSLKVVVITLAGVFSFVLIFVIWQIMLGLQLSQKGGGCGGDWNYMVKCPFGSRCLKPKNGSPLMGGSCKPYISVLNYETEGSPQSKGEDLPKTKIANPKTEIPVSDDLAPDCSKVGRTEWVSYKDNVIELKHPESIKLTTPSNTSYYLHGEGCYYGDYFTLDAAFPIGFVNEENLTSEQIAGGAIPNSLEGWVDSRGWPSETEHQEVKMVNRRAIKIVSTLKGGKYTSAIYVWKGSSDNAYPNPFELRVESTKQDNLVFEEFVSSLKFLESS